MARPARGPPRSRTAQTTDGRCRRRRRTYQLSPPDIADTVLRRKVGRGGRRLDAEREIVAVIAWSARVQLPSAGERALRPARRARASAWVERSQAGAPSPRESRQRRAVECRSRRPDGRRGSRRTASRRLGCRRVVTRSRRRSRSSPGARSPPRCGPTTRHHLPAGRLGCEPAPRTACGVASSDQEEVSSTAPSSLDAKRLTGRNGSRRQSPSGRPRPPGTALLRSELSRNASTSSASSSRFLEGGEVPPRRHLGLAAQVGELALGSRRAAGGRSRPGSPRPPRGR